MGFNRIKMFVSHPLELPSSGDVFEVALWGLWYNDKFIRTPKGWRTKEKVTEPCYSWKIQRSRF